MPPRAYTRILLVIIGAINGCSDPAAPLRPTMGGIEVVATTSGPAPDPNGYELRVDGQARNSPLPPNGKLVIEDLPLGQHQVELGDLAANCAPIHGYDQSVEVVAGSTVRIDFTVACLAGSILVITHTSGEEPSARYEVRVDDGEPHAIGGTDSLRLDSVPAGDHVVRVQALAENCTTSTSPQHVVVTPGELPIASFEISCPALHRGKGIVQVYVHSDLINFFTAPVLTATLDGRETLRVPSNASASFVDVSAGEHTILLSGFPRFCGINPFSSSPTPNPARSMVFADQVTTVLFRVLCLG
jgi:hypothetical protein